MAWSFLLRRDGVNNVDYQISGGKIVLSSGADAARDRLFTSLSTQLEEWYLNLEDGVPYYGDNGILGGKKTEGEVAAIIRRRILLDYEVSRIVSLSLAKVSRRGVNCTAEVLLKLTNGTSETMIVEV